MFVNTKPKLAAGNSFLGLFLELPRSLPIDFLTFFLEFVDVGVQYPLPSVYKLPIEALLK
jgi:hypothetical protein